MSVTRGGSKSDNDSWARESRASISVLLPVFNDWCHIREALDSLLQQVVCAAEILVIDDGSTTTLEEAFGREWICPPTVRVIRTEHRGVAHALNVGIRHALGEFIARQDADDRSHPDRFWRQLSKLNSEPLLAAVGTYTHFQNETGSVIGVSVPPIDPTELRQTLMKSNPLVHGSVMIRRSVLVALGGYVERYILAQDYDLWLRLTEHHMMSVVPEYLYRCLIRENSWSRRDPLLYRLYQERAIADAQTRATECTAIDPLPSQPDESLPSWLNC